MRLLIFKSFGKNLLGIKDDVNILFLRKHDSQSLDYWKGDSSSLSFVSEASQGSLSFVSETSCNTPLLPMERMEKRVSVLSQKWLEIVSKKSQRVSAKLLFLLDHNQYPCAIKCNEIYKFSFLQLLKVAIKGCL